MSDYYDFKPVAQDGWVVHEWWFDAVAGRVRREQYPLAGWLLTVPSDGRPLHGRDRNIIPAIWSTGDGCLMPLDELRHEVRVTGPGQELAPSDVAAIKESVAAEGVR